MPPPSTALALAHGLAFADLYSVDGAARIDALFLAAPARRATRRWPTASPPRAREPGALGRQGRVGAADRARAAPRGLPRAAVRHRGRSARARGAPPRARAALRGQAPVRPAQGDERVQGRRRGDVRRRRAARASSRRASARRCRPTASSRSRNAVTRWQQDEAAQRRAARPRAALRGVGGAHAGRPRRAPRRRAVPRAAQARLHAARAARGRHASAASTAWKLAGDHAAPARRLRADRPRHRPRRRRSTRRTTASGATSRARTRARTACPRRSRPTAGAANPFKKTPVRRDARRLPAGGEDLRVPQAARRRLAARRAGDDLRRQSDGRRHRPPDLQRLHEVLHLPEAGPGRHPAGGDAHPEGRAGAALGLRDLLAADALESAQPAPPAAARARRASACWSSAWGRPASRSRIT